MIHPLLEKYIPSRSYVKFLKEQDAVFTDFETAAILGDTGLPLEEKLSAWRSLLEETEDRELKRQLAGEIAHEEKSLEQFQSKTEGPVYMIRDGDWDAVGLAENYETACAIALTLESGFTIEKYQPTAKYNGPTVKEFRVNPYLWPDTPIRSVLENAPGPIGGARFRRDGVLLSVWNEGTDDDAGVVERRYSPAYFTNAFVKYPYPFERGDIVRFVACREKQPEDKYPGIVATSQEDWTKFLEKVRGGLYVDISDASAVVEWLTPKGGFSHGHVSPIFLERYEPEKEQPWHALIKAGSELIRGEGSLEWYMSCFEAYRSQRKSEKLAEKTARWHEVQDLF